jgi:ABC-type polysaccharide/polyol phosphate transport system ATPase subunit
MSDVVVRFDNAGKMYKVFASRRDHLLDALGFQRLVDRRGARHREFWALRGINFELRRGERLGIIGRNGAGKSTLLKLVTGNVPPTEGMVTVNGDVQALLEIGGGLHPEFTGRENAYAALSFLGVSQDEIETLTDGIVEFTELGRFLDQPFKTYSQGMQARLSFGIATAVQPDILIIDEILGAGDAYFFTKSTARMRELLDGGASVLLVSHALNQIVRFCDQSIWLDRGQIVMRGPSTEVVKAYEKFIREIDDRRLLAKNRKSRLRQFDAFERDSYADQLSVKLRASEPAAVREVALVRDGRVEDRVLVGDAQDANESQSAFVVLEDDAWSQPLEEDGAFLRRLGSTPAALLFNLWFYYTESAYTVAVTYRSETPVHVTVRRGAHVIATDELPPCDDWREHRVPLDTSVGDTGDDDEAPHTAISRWPGEGSLMIHDVLLVDVDGTERALFHAHSPMSMAIHVRARHQGSYPVTPVAVMYRADGVLISNFVGPEFELDLAEGDDANLALDFGPLNLGSGTYVFSVALYRSLSSTEPSEAYDLLDRSYEFEVVGDDANSGSVFAHPGVWTVVRTAETATPTDRTLNAR